MVQFPSSIWSQLLTAANEPDRVKEAVVVRYRSPVYEFVRQQGLSHEDAEDVTQEVFIRITRDEFLRNADRRKGRFRTLLLAVTRNVIASFRRHELAQQRDRRRQVALDNQDVPAEAPPDAEFDRLWALNLVRHALERMKDESCRQALQLQLDGLSYAEIASRLAWSEYDVTNTLHKARKLLRQEMERAIAEYAGAGEVSAEIADLLKYV